MRRALFGLWLVSSVVLLFVLGGLLHPPVLQLGAPSSLLVGAIWLVGVVPLSFTWWFREEHQRERQVVELALKNWRAGAAGAGTLVARALELALADEDEDSLRKLLDALAHTAPAPLEAELRAFMAAAHAWLSDDGGRSSREEHLDLLKQSARPLLPKLAASP